MIDEVINYAIKLKNEHGLHDWDVRLKNTKRIRGQTAFNHSRKKGIIFLSRYHILYGAWNDMENTIRHEIAHAIDFMERGHSAHDEVWKRIAEKVGAIPKASTESENNALELPHKYEFCCPECDFRIPRYRRPRKHLVHLCPECHKKGRQVKLNFITVLNKGVKQ